MRPEQIIQNITGQLRHWFTWITTQLTTRFSRTRIALFAVTLIAVGIALGGLDTKTADLQPAYNSVLDIELPTRTHLEAIQPPALEETVPALSELEWINTEVQSGQTLDTIFRGQGFSPTLLHHILRLSDETKGLTKIKPGQIFSFQKDDAGDFRSMRYELDEARYLMVYADGDELSTEILDREITTQLREANGRITSSLYLAGRDAGLSDAMVMKLANVFQWDIDFILDIRQGDHFYLMYEQLYRDGEFLRDGEVVAATFINQGEPYRAVRHIIDDQTEYFAPDGRNMRKAFLRAPLNFSYISSNFNPKRFHPILKRVKAHNGIDYRAPTGTPVYAAGDGTVTHAAYNQYNGNYVFIEHANGIVTKYLHFTKRAVKRGQRVKQGQTIGYVGATGLAQAPHLHYEFVVNGVHRNPRTIPLPKVEALKGDALAQFRQTAAPLLTQLTRLEASQLYASSE